MVTQNTQVTGTIPAAIGGMTKLQNLYLYGYETYSAAVGPSFYGTIPPTLSLLSKLEVLCVGPYLFLLRRRLVLSVFPRTFLDVLCLRACAAVSAYHLAPADRPGFLPLLCSGTCGAM